jgi:hypothetical protein
VRTIFLRIGGDENERALTYLCIMTAGTVGPQGGGSVTDPFPGQGKEVTMRRVLLAAAALSIPISGLAVGLSISPAWAAVKITCTTVTGTETGTTTLSNCTGGVTGGSSLPLSSTVLATGGTITWTSGSTTTVAAPVLKSTSAKKCPVSGSSADKFTAKVTGDTGDGLKVPGKATGAVCLAPSGAITALKPLKFT